MRMRNLIAGAVLSIVLVSCSPVLDRDLMERGTREFNPSHLVETPEAFKDHLFVFGGVIVGTKLTEEGSQIEGLFVPVDRWGYLRDSEHYQGRFIAIYPRSRGLLDPMIYKKGRWISLAADFEGARKAKLDEIEFTYPVFGIRQIYLWDQYADHPAYYYYPYPYPYYYGYPYYPYYDPWPAPYPYWGPRRW